MLQLYYKVINHDSLTNTKGDDKINMLWFDIFFRGFRPRKARDNTIPKKQYRDGIYTTSQHCIQRMQLRKITKGELHVSLHTKPLAITREIDKLGRPAKIRYCKNRMRTVVNPDSKVIASIRNYKNKELISAKRRKKK